MKQEIKNPYTLHTTRTMTRRITFICTCVGIGIIVFCINMLQSENSIHDYFDLEQYGFNKNKASSLRGVDKVDVSIISSSEINDNDIIKSSKPEEQMGKEESNYEELTSSNKELIDKNDDIPSIEAPSSKEPDKNDIPSVTISNLKEPEVEQKQKKSPPTPKVTKPILVVGLPKAGTTSIYEYFKCGGFKTSHWRCRTHKELCGALIHENVDNHRPPLENTGGYDVYAQLDGDCYFPQISALEELHQHYPDATLILNQRNITSWMHSMRTFYAAYSGILPKYKKMTLCDISEKNSTDEQYTKYYNDHMERIYKFVEKYPSHLLVEISIDDDKAGEVMEGYFGVNAGKCWGQANKDQKEIPDKKEDKAVAKPQSSNNRRTVQKPILVVGLPKSGTTTVYEYFTCGGGYKASHWKCGNNDLCGAIIRENVKNNRPPLENTGGYDVYAQLDGDCYFPQISAMEQLHQYYPHATFILNLRDAQSWVKSVRNFQPGSGAYMEKYGGMPHVCNNRTDEEMVEHYNHHVEFIRSFVKTYPSHKLVEFVLEDERAGGVMEDAFGIDRKCWGMSNVNEKNHDTALATTNEPKVTKPILVVGMPKGGTTTLADYFTCGGMKVSHWRCGGQDKLCGALIRENIKNNRPPLENTGDYEVYAQMDGDCFFPQIVALEELHTAYPDATFILNLRDAESWVRSINSFQPGKGAYIEEYGGMPHPCTNHSDTDQVANYNAHTERIHDFVAKHPSHKLVEFRLEDENAGKIMQNAFGIDAGKCWGMANVNEKIHEKENKQVVSVVPKVTKPILVVGMPKGGTTTLAEYFTCGGLRVSHWRCGGQDELCGGLIRENVKNNRPPLENTGGYDVYAQLDGDCYFPQIVALEEIHAAYPSATLILNLRNAESWVKSVENFQPDHGAYIPKYGMPHPCTNQTNVDKVANYNKHTQRIRDFAAKYPSHRLVEFYLEDEGAGKVMEDAFGISAKKCWGKANVNEKIH